MGPDTHYFEFGVCPADFCQLPGLFILQKGKQNRTHRTCNAKQDHGDASITVLRTSEYLFINILMFAEKYI